MQVLCEGIVVCEQFPLQTRRVECNLVGGEGVAHHPGWTTIHLEDWIRNSLCGEEVKRGMHTFEFLLAIYCDTALPCGYHVDAITSSGGGIRGPLLVRVRVVSWKTCRTALVVIGQVKFLAKNIEPHSNQRNNIVLGSR